MGEIHTVWSYNGAIFFKYSVNDDAILVEHRGCCLLYGGKIY